MPVAKKKKSKIATKKVSEKQLQQMAEKALQDFKDASEDRYKRAMVVYNEQDSETKDALDRMIDLLSGIARRRIWVAPSRGSEHRAVVLIPDHVVRQNMVYMAVEVLKDLAQMDVRVANFSFPKTLCIVCNNPVKKRKKGVK